MKNKIIIALTLVSAGIGMGMTSSALAAFSANCESEKQNVNYYCNIDNSSYDCQHTQNILMVCIRRS